MAVLPLSAAAAVVTVEVGQGEDRRWLVLGVTPQGISTLHTMAPQAEAAGSVPRTAQPAFAQLLQRLRQNGARRAMRTERAPAGARCCWPG